MFLRLLRISRIILHPLWALPLNFSSCTWEPVYVSECITVVWHGFCRMSLNRVSALLEAVYFSELITLRITPNVLVCFAAKFGGAIQQTIALLRRVLIRSILIEKWGNILHQLVTCLGCSWQVLTEYLRDLSIYIHKNDSIMLSKPNTKGSQTTITESNTITWFSSHTVHLC